MKSRTLALAIAGILIAQTALAADVPAGTKTYQLRYLFKPGEKVRTKVIHQAAVETQIDGTKQTVDTLTTSIKVWDIGHVSPEGEFDFVHSVERVLMKNRMTGREETIYDSRNPEPPPKDFERVAARVGVPLTEVTMNPQGKVLKREEKAAEKSLAQAGQMTIPLPEKEIAIGQTWDVPQLIPVTLQSGVTKRIQTRQRFTLKSVKTGVATIDMKTQVLSPINDPEIQAALVQRISEGTIRFDIDAGRVLSQQIDLDRRVVGFPNASSIMHYRTRFTEKLLPANTVAAKPKEVAAEPKEKKTR